MIKHMKKVTLVLLVVMIFLAQVPQILALEILVDSTGTAFIYENDVLGDEEDATKEEREDKKVEPFRTVSNREEKKIKIEANKKAIKVKLERENKSNAGTKITEKEEIETKRIKLLAPAGPTAIKAGDSADDTSELTKKQVELQEQLREERQERHEETLELRSEINEVGETELELESRKIKAKIKQGAQFQLDPTTNQVSIVTPSGNTHVLEHLPDQAIERMKEHGLFSDTLDEAQIEIETKDTGEVVYKVEGTRRKHIFGVIPREVETEIELDDATGEVTETEVSSPSLLDQFLDAVSF